MFDLLAQRNIQRVVDSLVDIRQYPENFIQLNRVPVVNALDGEIFARFKGRVVMADILSLTGKAPLRATPEATLEQTGLPILKHGRGLNREEIRLLDRIESNMAGTRDRNMLIERIGVNTGDLVKGVWMTMNYMLYGMKLDSLLYNRKGIMFNATFGMPSDLKLTNTGVDLWSAASTATPITDVDTIRKTAKNKYGINLNRMTLSQTAFDYAIRTDEFQDLAETLFRTGANTLTFPYQNMERMLDMATSVFGMVIEIDDSTGVVENNDGTYSYPRNLPENKVLLDSTADDNQESVWDFANAMVEEAIPGMVPAMIGAPEGGPYGPFGYTTAADPQGNPPGINMWAVGSGFPRKHEEAHSAVLTVLA